MRGSVSVDMSDVHARRSPALYLVWLTERARIDNCNARALVCEFNHAEGLFIPVPMSDSVPFVLPTEVSSIEMIEWD